MATVVIDRLYINNDNDIWLKGFRDSRAASGVYLNAATVTYTIKTAAGTTFKTATTMSYVTGTDGNYVGSLDKTDAATLVPNGVYYVEVSATEGDVDGFWREQTIAEERET